MEEMAIDSSKNFIELNGDTESDSEFVSINLSPIFQSSKNHSFAECQEKNATQLNLNDTESRPS